MSLNSEEQGAKRFLRCNHCGNKSERGTPEQWEKLRRPFPDNQIEWLKKFKNGAALPYVGHASITERIGEIDPFWCIHFAYFNTETLEPIIDTENGAAYFLMTVLGSRKLCVGGTGGKPLHENGMKELLGDAIRNGAMRHGVGTYLWSKSEESEGRKRNPFWQERLDAATTVEEIRQIMGEWQESGQLTGMINRYAMQRVNEVQTNAAE